MENTILFCEYSVRAENDDHLLAAYREMLDKIERGITFSFARYGDGEYNSLIGSGYNERTSSGNAYTPKIQKLIKQTIDEPHTDEDYWYSISPAGRRFKEFDHINWRDADLVSAASFHGELKPFINILNNKTSILVAPKYLHAVKINFNEYYEIPIRDSYNTIETIVPDIKNIIKKHKNPIVCIIGGTTSEVLVYQLHPFIKQKGWLIDIGAVFDAYVDQSTRSGRIRRSYFKHLTEEVKAKNGL